MKIIPIAFDSMGVRSMCTFVTTEKLNILIDPGLALATKRLGYPPTNIEMNTFYVFKNKIVEFAKKADIIIITHYHYDHYVSSHDENFRDIYSDKIVLCKNRKTKLNFRQRTRGKEFELSVKRICKEFHFIDGKTFNYEDAKIEFSDPLWHGTERGSYGYIIMTTIHSGGKKFLFTSDVMGPIQRENADYIIKEEPDLLFLCGPPTHLLGYDLTHTHMNMVRGNVKKIIEEVSADTIVYDHYILRDKEYEKYFEPWRELAEENDKKFITAAEYVGVPIRQLEAHRPELSEEE